MIGINSRREKGKRKANVACFQLILLKYIHHNICILYRHKIKTMTYVLAAQFEIIVQRKNCNYKI